MQIMDVTLRDGSYAINFQFSEYDTEKICSGLNGAGIKYIEIGHGMGLEASSPAGGLALCTDAEYLQAAKRAVPDAKYGMFCIPTYASVDSLDLLKENGASFVRVGSNVSEVETTKEYIERAKALGLEVMANYMKSYVATPEEFAENVKKSESWGADVVYVVDSAGSMDSHDVEKYFEAVKKVSNIKVGFHGHNNLGLAVANSIYAMDLGYDFVDTAMLGMGRSAGNAATELFVGNLVKRKMAEEIELDKIMECAEKYVRPLMKHYPNALDLYCGIAQFHTSYMKYIQKYSMKYRVNPLKLILEYSEYDKVNMDEAALDKIASGMAKDENCVLTDFGFNEYIGDEQNGRK
ncbi:MAG: 4-hydroxy-2-oxovalerate aldolase [Lachnospiraceae bacterium]|nr:4-hydroxy-2-oxovalerate aldolase [Candidatus Colinaster scatohippi]